MSHREMGVPHLDEGSIRIRTQSLSWIRFVRAFINAAAARTIINEATMDKLASGNSGAGTVQFTVTTAFPKFPALS